MPPDALGAAIEAHVAELVDRRLDERLKSLGLERGELDPLVALAELLPVSRSQANRLAREGAIAGASLVGRVWCARRSAVESYLAERRASGRTPRPARAEGSPADAVLAELGFDEPFNDTTRSEGSASTR